MTTPALRPGAEASMILDQCLDLELEVRLVSSGPRHVVLTGPGGEEIGVDLDHHRHSFVEQVLRQVKFEFKKLPLLVMGDSKEIRLLTPKIAQARLLPTLYSFTFNRYGEVSGTEDIRARFSAEIFRKMALSPGPYRLSSAFLALVESPEGPLLAERRVEVCNLETRVKRYHIGPPHPPLPFHRGTPHGGRTGAAALGQVHGSPRLFRLAASAHRPRGEPPGGRAPARRLRRVVDRRRAAGQVPGARDLRLAGGILHGRRAEADRHLLLHRPKRRNHLRGNQPGLHASEDTRLRRR
ncbi:hypothetical protein ACFY5D_01020 [Paeniglutamicibacter sp. NPDC012692]|uniref:hypothetical protein n=1 Tax=Paeniglutamicibacter sp. NPDC012692 TaxID=3364388 RepID=UPI0036A58D9E